MNQKEPQKEEKKEDKPERNTFKRYAALAGIGFQMGAIIYVFSLIGKKLDNRYSSDKPWFTIGAVLLGVIVSGYSVISQLNRINKR